MRIHRCILLILGSWFGLLPAQGPQFDFLTVADGLSANVILAIHRDQQGFVWVGSTGGLQRYDGYEFESIVPLQGTGIKAITEDAKGGLWVGTAGNGLWYRHPKQGNWQSLAFDAQGDTLFPYLGINQIVCDAHGQVWVAGARHLVRIQAKETFQVETIPAIKDQTQSLLPGKDLSLALDSLGNLWVATYNEGFSLLSADQLQLPVEQMTWLRQPLGSEHMPLRYARLLITDRRGTIWMRDRQQVMGFLLPDSSQNLDPLIPETIQSLGYRKFKHIERSDFGRLQQQSAHVTSMSQASDSSVWLATSFGLYHYSYASDSLSYFSRQSMGIPSQGLNALICVYQDAHDLLWMGSIEGLAKPADRQAAFRSLTPGGKGLSLVKAIEVDQFGQRWLGIENGGLQVFAPGENQAYLQIRLNGPYSGLNYDFIMDLCEDQQGHMWAATYGGGVHRLSLARNQTGKITSYENQVFLPRADGKGLHSYYYYSLLEADDGKMWMGSFDDVGYFDDTLDEFRSFKVPVANFLIQDQSHQIWIATDEGLYQYFAQRDTIEKIDLLDEEGKIYSPRIECIAITPDGKLWAATLKGLLQINPETGSYQTWTQADGLPHDQVMGLTVDKNGKLWASTLLGIARVGDSPFRVFRQAQGLSNESFSSRSIAVDALGNVYFGGKNGVDYFQVDELHPSPQVSSLVLTRLRIFNQRVGIGDSLETGFVLKESLDQLTQLELSHREQMVGFEFAGLGFRQSQSYRYAYQLEGFDEGWRATDANQRLATYTNLPPGMYTFRVKVAPGNSEWEKGEAALSVRVYPPWWNSPWAWFVYALLGGMLAWLLIRLRIQALRREMVVQQRIGQAKAEEREQVRARSARDFHDEAGGQLTKLALYTGLIRRQTESSGDTPYLDKLEQNIAALSQSMRDFIWVLDSRHDNLEETLLRIRSWAEELFEAAKPDFIFSQQHQLDPETPIPLATRRHLLFICKEALNNALKYAEASEVRLKVQTTSNLLSFEISDDGIGFHPQQLHRINGLSNMEERAKEIGAKFSLESLPGVGTRIAIEVPIHPNG